MIQSRVGSQEDRDDREPREPAGIRFVIALNRKVSVNSNDGCKLLTNLHLTQMCNENSSWIRRLCDDSSTAQSVSILNCTKHRTDVLYLSHIRAMRTQVLEHGLKDFRTMSHAVVHLLIQVHVPPGLRNIRASRTLTVTGTIAIHNAPEKVQEKTEILLLGYRIHDLPIVRLDHRFDGFDESSQLRRGIDRVVSARVLIES
jgi:hypothetical protein